MTVKRIGGKLTKSKLRCLCGVRFTPKRSNQQHCSPQCRVREAQRQWRERKAMAKEISA